ncbi:type II secretion system ATPase GspE [Trichlorobacter ammonificans]|uniref:protein-secreting ATPase n=1 Tax=Trichlorobacter ammonificans TaxID=2916410 RepID=A0ABM9DA95_9BACT|nr:type II secretion system ATPase GspE [Trichlorobacter ammonificans]CAH2031544.1 Type II secretion system protein GspE [Trichlorobacter ammonificans]
MSMEQTAADIRQIADRLGLPFAEQIDDTQADPSLLSRLPLAFARSRCLLPLAERDGRLELAVGRPLDLLAQDEVAQLYGTPLSVLVAPEGEVLAAINRLYARTADTARDVVENLVADDLTAIATELAHPKDLLDLTDEAPVIRLLNAILFQAVKERASDIHIEPYERTLEVRFRIDGILHVKLEPPKLLQEALVSRVKIMSSLNIAEKRLPQDGRFKVLVAGHEVDIRVSLVPTFFGERTVLRLLDRKQGVRSLSEIGFSPRDVTVMERLISRTSGIILVTGPTGSGKTTTLYAALSQLNRQERNLITIEDPIEYQLSGVGQIQVNSRIDLTFAAGLRAVLRQDPDVIMVGEIRDAETAEIAMQASLTGHLVLSTLHTNDAATAITRLIDMGIEPFMVASSLSGILAQRLVRTICPHCREAYTNDQPMPGLPDTLYRGKGCPQCYGQGTLGRVGIYELLPIDAELCGMITRRTPAGEIKEYAIRKGMKTIREDGLAKVAAGITTLEEVLRVTQEEYADLPV